MATLCCHTTDTSYGYWRIQPVHQRKISALPEVYLTVVQGRIVFADQQPLSWAAFHSQLLKYIPRLRSPKLKLVWQLAQENVEKGTSIPTVLSQLVLVENLFTHKEVMEAVQLACFNLLEPYYELEGEAAFLVEKQVAGQKPILGFSPYNLQAEMEERRSQWDHLKTSIPSTQHIVVGHRDKIENLVITENQRQHLLFLTQRRRSIDQIAQDLGSDRLKIAKILEPLIRAGLATLKADSQTNTIDSLQPLSQPSIEIGPAQKHETIQAIKLPSDTPQFESDELGKNSVKAPSKQLEKVDIFVVDDSPILLKQFETLVSQWGYSVRSCSRASRAVEELLDCRPSIIFVDINMPEISGFQLLREIRLQPELSKIQVVILTAEESFSNAQRARWSKCDFLAKPLNSQDVHAFRSELMEILSQCESLVTI